MYPDKIPLLQLQHQLILISLSLYMRSWRLYQQSVRGSVHSASSGIHKQSEGRSNSAANGALRASCVQKLLNMIELKKQGIIEGVAVKAHKCSCRKLKLNPAVRVAEGMRQMLRRRSGDSSGPSAKRFGRSVGDD